MTMTNEQLAEAVARIFEVDAKRPAIDLNTAEIHEDGLTYECPLCQGEGYVDGHQYINVGDKALNVFFSGIGSEFVDARRFFDAAPLMVRIIRQLWEEREGQRAVMAQAKVAELWAAARQAATAEAEAEIRRWKARCIAAENGHPQVKEATAEADARYMPMVERLVEAQRKVLRDPGMHGLSINTRERIHSALALAKPLLEKKEEV